MSRLVTLFVVGFGSPAITVAVERARSPTMYIDVGRWARRGTRKVPAKLSASKPDAFDFHYRNRPGQSEVKRDGVDERRVVHAFAITVAFDDKALAHGNLVADCPLRSAGIPGNMARTHAGKHLLPEPVDHVVDRLALAGIVWVGHGGVPIVEAVRREVDNVAETFTVRYYVVDQLGNGLLPRC